MSEHVGDEDAGPGSDPPPNDPHSDPRDLEEYKHIATSLLDSWPVQESRLRDVQRLWPVVDPSLPRGFLRAPLSVEKPINKRKRAHKLPQPPSNPPSSPTADDNATLPFPSSFPGVSQEKIDKLMVDKKTKCGECAGCQPGSRQKACDVRKAVTAWDAELGGVSPAMILQIKDRLAHPVRHENNHHAAVRCGKCHVCRAEMRSRCATVVALLDGTLPPRLQHVVDAAQGGGPWDAVLPWRSDKERKESYHPFSERCIDDENDRSDGSESDSEEDLRWKSWAPWLPGGTLDDGTTVVQRPPPGALQDKSEVWVCRSHSKIQTKEKNKKNKKTVDGEGSFESSSEMEEDDDIDGGECGHMNSGRALRCFRCKAPRWTGPTGELRARVAAALQTGAMAAGGRGLEELAATIAAKLAHEAGSDPSQLLSVGAGSEADLVTDIMKELQAVRRTMLETKNEEHVAPAVDKTVEGRGDEQERILHLGRAARKTVFGRATRKLEEAVTEVVEDQAAKERWKIECSGSTRGTQRAVNGGGQRVNAAILAGVDGGAGSGTLVGYTSFCKKIQAALLLSESSESVSVQPLPTHRPTTTSLCDLLFPLGPQGGAWDASSLECLEALLGAPSEIASLHNAAQQGGLLYLKKVLHSSIAAQKASMATAAAAAREEEERMAMAGAFSPGEMFLAPTQQSQLDPTAPPAAAAPLPPRDPPEGAPSQTQNAQNAPSMDNDLQGGALENPLIQDIEGSAAPGAPTMEEVWRRDLENSIGGALRGGTQQEQEGSPSCPAEQYSAVDAERAEQHRMRLLQTVSASTLQLVYGLTHATLSKVSVKEAKGLVPTASRPTVKTFLERAQFSSFPPLPAPTWTHVSPPGTTSAGTAHEAGMVPGSTSALKDGHTVVAPIPDCSRPVHSMVTFHKNNRAGKRKHNFIPPPPPPPGPGGAFASYAPPHSQSLAHTLEEPQISQEQGTMGGSRKKVKGAHADSINKCRKDARLVLKTALEMGVRPELVARAAQRAAQMAPQAAKIPENTKKRGGDTEEQEEEEEGDE